MSTICVASKYQVEYKEIPLSRETIRYVIDYIFAHHSELVTNFSEFLELVEFNRDKVKELLDTVNKGKNTADNLLMLEFLTFIYNNSDGNNKYIRLEDI